MGSIHDVAALGQRTEWSLPQFPLLVLSSPTVVPPSALEEEARMVTTGTLLKSPQEFGELSFVSNVDLPLVVGPTHTTKLSVSYHEAKVEIQPMDATWALKKKKKS